AIPSGVVGVAYRELRKFGHLHRAQIGIGMQTITPTLAAALNLPRNYGVVISDVLPDTPAMASGLQIGDVLAAIDTPARGESSLCRVSLLCAGIWAKSSFGRTSPERPPEL